MEGIQRLDTRMVKSMRDLSDQDKLRRLKNFPHSATGIEINGGQYMLKYGHAIEIP